MYNLTSINIQHHFPEKRITRTPSLIKIMKSNQNNVAVQRYPFISAFKTEFKPSVTRKNDIVTGFSGSSALAQPVYSLKRSTWNSQPGPPLPGQDCVTGSAGSIARAPQRAWSCPGRPLPPLSLPWRPVRLLLLGWLRGARSSPTGPKCSYKLPRTPGRLSAKLDWTQERGARA
jgi:hypothetical protein